MAEQKKITTLLRELVRQLLGKPKVPDKPNDRGGMMKTLDVMSPVISGRKKH